MNRNEQPGGASKNTEGGELSAAELVEKDFKNRILEAAKQGDLNEVTRICLERQRVIEENEKQGRAEEDEESRLERFRREIPVTEGTIANIAGGGGSFETPEDRERTLKTARARLAGLIEDLSIAEGTAPTYEEQIKALWLEIAELKERVARRWEEISQENDQSRIDAFLGGVGRRPWGSPGLKPYESALKHVEDDIGQHDLNHRPKELRDILVFIKNKLEERLRQSEKNPETRAD